METKIKQGPLYSGSQIDVRFLGRSIPIPKLPLYSKNGQEGCFRPYPIVYYTYLRNAIASPKPCNFCIGSGVAVVALSLTGQPWRSLPLQIAPMI